MARIVDSRTSLDRTVRIFDEFYGFNLVINAGDYDVVRSYFMGVCDAVQSAENFTVYLFRIAQETQIPIMDLLDYIRGKSALEVNTVLGYYLNSFKSKTALYGFGAIPKPNQPVARNVVL